MWVVIGWMGFVAVSGLVLIAWGLRTHQFDDLEDVKNRMLEDHEPQEWPGRAGSGRGVHGA
jgi:cbb3-type cytochrome oxidase maturation protein